MFEVLAKVTRNYALITATIQICAQQDLHDMLHRFLIHPDEYCLVLQYTTHHFLHKQEC